MDFEWDQAKSERNDTERGLPFELALLLFDGPVIEQVDDRRAYGEVRVRVIGAIGASILHCVYTMRGPSAESSACAMQAGESEMPIVRRTRNEIDDAKLRDDLAARPQPTEEEIEAQVAADDDGWADEELQHAQHGYTPPSPDQVRALRAKLRLTQLQFAQRYGFTLDAVQQYEQGRRRPSGSAATLLRVIDVDPEWVARALRQRKTG
jgi:DNA-binding transcriptional regulator YiaG/uncharacterized DUF497 family protein